MTRIIRCAADAQGLDFLVADNLLDAETCDRLSAVYRENTALFEQGAADPFWNDRIIFHHLLAAPARETMVEATRSGIGAISEFYGVSPLHPDVISLVGWPAGMHMPPHADNANPNGEPHEFAHRDFSGVIYLSDDHEGGDLYLPHQDIAIRPRRGMLVSLPAGLTHLHGVSTVFSGLRLTLAFFLTRDVSRAIRPDI